MRELLLGPLRYGGLAAALPGVGSRMLAERLKHLVGIGAVELRRLPAPASVDAYALTERGIELAGVLDSLGTWGMPLLATAKENKLRPSSTAAALVLWKQAGRCEHPVPGQWRLELGTTAYAFDTTGKRVLARRGEGERADGSAKLSAEDVFALLGGRIGAAKLPRAGRLVTGRLDERTFRQIFLVGIHGES